jgi:hypothetical protein
MFQAARSETGTAMSLRPNCSTSLSLVWSMPLMVTARTSTAGLPRGMSGGVVAPVVGAGAVFAAARTDAGGFAELVGAIVAGVTGLVGAIGAGTAAGVIDAAAGGPEAGDVDAVGIDSDVEDFSVSESCLTLSSRSGD